MLLLAVALVSSLSANPLETVRLRLSRGPVGGREQAELVAELRRFADHDGPAAEEAAYLLARIYQLHAVTPDPRRAADEFQRLARRHPAGYWAQLGLVKLALLALFELPADSSEQRFETAAGCFSRLSDPALRRDLHLAIGRAGLVYRRPPAEVLDHLLAADGDLEGDELWRADLQVQIGELALRSGRLQVSRRYFERFLRHNGHDPRAYAVRQKLDLLAATTDGAPTARP